jgi:alanine-glyoxylate transaminase/serine-glyoxylate transaminase/serine-pyruvate transaminase
MEFSMPLANGRHFLAIPGPSVMPDVVLRAMHRPATNIYEGPLIDMTITLYGDLKRIARTEAEAMIFISNGHGGWEAVISNTLDEGDKVLALCSGRFGEGWAEKARNLGADPELLHAPARRGIDPQAVEDRLRADTGHQIKAVTAVQIDTATGVWNDIEAIRAAINAAGHPALFMVDCIASLGCTPYEMDKWGVDVTVAAAQKGLMTPPGLSFVFANDRALARRQTMKRSVSYWDWNPRTDPDVYYKRFCGTAPIHLLYALREALDMILAEGLPAIHARHRTIAGAVQAAVIHWGSEGPLELNITDPAARSDSVTTILGGGIDVEELRSIAEKNLAVTLGIGLGFEPGEAFRIGHMGHVNAPMILGTLGVIELALGHIGAPHAKGGVEAAIRALASGVA